MAGSAMYVLTQKWCLETQCVTMAAWDRLCVWCLNGSLGRQCVSRDTRASGTQRAHNDTMMCVLVPIVCQMLSVAICDHVPVFVEKATSTSLTECWFDTLFSL